MLKRGLDILQRIGAALMMPVAVLPVAGLLLGLGASKFSFLPPVVSGLMAQSGGVIFTVLPLIFALAVALSFTDSDVVGGISAVITYVVMLAVMGVMAQERGVGTQALFGIPSIDTGVFGGVLAGAVAALLYNRYHRVELPPALAFFSGRRLVPVLCAGAGLLLGVSVAFIWPTLQGGIEQVSHWAVVTSPRTASSVYAFVERLLIPFGLHHIWNVPFFFEMGAFTDASGKVVHGDISRFFAGDPTAGTLGGAYLFKMFGLPGAAIAMWQMARPEHRLRVGGVMFSGALTSFLTGVTEPIEFAFLFAAPPLYLVHALLAALSQFVINSLDVHLGFTFSQGAIDLLAFNAFSPNARGVPWVLALGPVYGLAYYGIFRFAIRRWSLRTPGREGEVETVLPADDTDELRGRALVTAFGGEANLTGLDACVTRLRISVKDPSLVDEARLRSLGAIGVVRVGDGVQAVFGPESEALKGDIQEFLKSSIYGTPQVDPSTRRMSAAATLARIARDHGHLSEDLAQARQRERMLEQNLERGRRLAGLGGVVSGVAHDLRTPITGIKLTLDGLARRRLDSSSQEDVQVCIDELGRLDRLVGQLMVVARSSAQPRDAVNLADVVDARLNVARQRAEARQVKLSRTGDAPTEAHLDTVVRVLDNLVNNAIDASPVGGTVTVRIDADAHEVRARVEDEGEGVPPSHAHEVFEPFFSLKPDGVGLGLFQSHALMLVQGGRLSYQREPQLTVFTVGLPRQPRE